MFFPARPINGGRLDLHPGIQPGFDATGKVDGFRVCILVSALLDGVDCCYNRHGSPLSIEHKFQPALAALRKVVDPTWAWVDAEGLAHRHRMAVGTIAVIDYVPQLRRRFSETYRERRSTLSDLVTKAPWASKLWEPNSLYLLPSFDGDPLVLWNALLQNNGDRFYEGVVRKRMDSHYPISSSPQGETADWQKHRW